MENEEAVVGFHFHPSDEELVDRYLNNRNRGEDSKIVPEFSINESKPCELHLRSDGAFYGVTRWKKKHPNSDLLDRSVDGGSWQATGPVTPVKNKNGVKIGERKTFRFLDRARRRTEWLMQQYASAGQKDFVLCKIKCKETRHRKPRVVVISARGGKQTASLAAESEILASPNAAEKDKKQAKDVGTSHGGGELFTPAAPQSENLGVLDAPDEGQGRWYAPESDILTLLDAGEEVNLRFPAASLYDELLQAALPFIASNAKGQSLDGCQNTNEIYSSHNASDESDQFHDGRQSLNKVSSSLTAQSENEPYPSNWQDPKGVSSSTAQPGLEFLNGPGDANQGLLDSKFTSQDYYARSNFYQHKARKSLSATFAGSDDDEAIDLKVRDLKEDASLVSSGRIKTHHRPTLPWFCFLIGLVAFALLLCLLHWMFRFPSESMMEREPGIIKHLTEVGATGRWSFY